ncbi:MAG: sulfite exporter TauE/SafE family protein [Arcanobacterium sp.]|nr:sulfite exporter TauE/SafE family protein [Arcanobacterium sp.]
MFSFFSVVILLAGAAAGAINTIVGSGSLVSYPAMVFLGIPPVSANIANTVGLMPGAIAGVVGYRQELRELPSSVVLRLSIASSIGAIGGAWLLTWLPSKAFQLIVPALIGFAAILVAVAPLIARKTQSRSTRWGLLFVSVLLTGIYGGYFSAAQGVLLIGVLGLFLNIGLQHQNALKNLLQALVNTVAAIYFLLHGGIEWTAVLWLAIGSTIGSYFGAKIAKRIPTKYFRIFIVVFGLCMAIVMAMKIGQ